MKIAKIIKLFRSPKLITSRKSKSHFAKAALNAAPAPANLTRRISGSDSVAGLRVNY